MEMCRNLLLGIGVPEHEIEKRVQDTFFAIFADENERFYFESGADAGYMLDTGNIDARTEGMSYGMMMTVQMNRKDVFDRLWTYSKRYMWNADGCYAGYFAWSTKPDGTRNSDGPAPDGEEYYAMALFLASERWGDGEPPYDYANQARDILRHMVHQHELVLGGKPMFTPGTALIKFIPDWEFSDPSYHLPHFYERFAALADPADRDFWLRAAAASRRYIVAACHPVTGLAPEYAHYDATPETTRGHGDFFSDAYRVALNIGMDATFCGQRPEWTRIIDNMQRFLADKEPFMTYAIDGTPKEPPALHPVGLLATVAAGAAATDTRLSREWVRRFWDTPPRKGDRRYYDNCLYFFVLLLLSGRYRLRF